MAQHCGRKGTHASARDGGIACAGKLAEAPSNRFNRRHDDAGNAHLHGESGLDRKPGRGHRSVPELHAGTTTSLAPAGRSSGVRPIPPGSATPAGTIRKTCWSRPLAACHMLWYLHLCTSNGIVVTAYEDAAEGVMRTHSDGAGEFTRVTLRPPRHDDGGKRPGDPRRASTQRPARCASSRARSTSRSTTSRRS